MRERDEPIPLPHNPMPYLVSWWLEIGPMHNEGPIDWQEMQAWQHATGIELSPWEALMIRRLSIEYLNMKHEARKPDCPPPHIEQSTIAARRDRVAGTISAALRKQEAT